jgi:hypothetical protein
MSGSLEVRLLNGECCSWYQSGNSMPYKDLRGLSLLLPRKRHRPTIGYNSDTVLWLLDWNFIEAPLRRET